MTFPDNPKSRRFLTVVNGAFQLGQMQPNSPGKYVAFVEPEGLNRYTEAVQGMLDDNINPDFILTVIQLASDQGKAKRI